MKAYGRRNLVSIVVFWVITSINYFLVAFELKYLNGGIFRDSMTSSLAEVVGCLMGGFLVTGLSSRFRV